MLVYPSSIDLSSRTLRFLTGQLTAKRRKIGTRWRRLSASRQALLALAHLRCGDTYAQLAAGFGIGIATVYRYIREAVDALSAIAPSLTEAMRTIRSKAFVILLPIDRIAADTPYYSGKRHGMNVEVLTDQFGRLLWASPTLPGSTHDLTAARHHGIIEALADAGTQMPGGQGVSRSRRTRPGAVTGRRLKRWKRRHNTTHAKIRCLGEQAMATLKGWRLLRKLRCSTNRVTDVLKAATVYRAGLLIPGIYLWSAR